MATERLVMVGQVFIEHSEWTKYSLTVYSNGKNIKLDLRKWIKFEKHPGWIPKKHGASGFCTEIACWRKILPELVKLVAEYDEAPAREPEKVAA